MLFTLIFRSCFSIFYYIRDEIYWDTLMRRVTNYVTFYVNILNTVLFISIDNEIIEWSSWSIIRMVIISCRINRQVLLSLPQIIIYRYKCHYYNNTILTLI